METEEWSIQQIAKIAGTTSRTLRHYGDIGLLPPSSIGQQRLPPLRPRALVRLQRILLLRELGPRACRRSPRCSTARHPRKTR